MKSLGFFSKFSLKQRAFPFTVLKHAPGTLRLLSNPLLIWSILNDIWKVTIHIFLSLPILTLTLVWNSHGNGIFHHVFSSGNVDVRLLYFQHVLDSLQHTLSNTLAGSGCRHGASLNCQDFCCLCCCRMFAGAPGRSSANELQAASSMQGFDYLPNLSKFLTSCFLFPPTKCPSGRHWIWGWNILIPGTAILSVWTTQGSVALFVFPTCLVGGLTKWEGFRLWVLEKYLSSLLLLLLLRCCFFKSCH